MSYSLSFIVITVEHSKKIGNTCFLDINFPVKTKTKSFFRYLIGAFMYAVQTFKIKRITHKYLIVGHTQNEGDTTHSVIEKQVC